MAIDELRGAAADRYFWDSLALVLEGLRRAAMDRSFCGSLALVLESKCMN